MSVRWLPAAAVLLMQSMFAQRVGAPTGELSDLSVDELFQIQVTSVGRKAQQRSKAPAAVFVLTGDDIRRSGATSIPEALQWVPGLNVFHIDGRYWAISVRGSSRLWADKILVMIDGRSLYTPFFGGVMWENLDIPMENIEQIEVVRGPGAVMWGPNAVNGVINIITKRARLTKGAEVSVASGNELHGSVMARYGASVGDHTQYRIWGKFDNRNPGYGSKGSETFNAAFRSVAPFAVEDLDSKATRAGFRVDMQPTARDEVMLQGDAYTSGSNEVVGYPDILPIKPDWGLGRTRDAGGFLQGRWTRTTSQAGETSVQFALDKQLETFPFVHADSNNLTLDVQNRRQLGEGNELYVGAGFQQYWDDSSSKRWVSLNPAQAVYRVGDMVLRDEWQLIPNKLLASAGVRLDYSSYTHLEAQPSFRLLFTPSARQSSWFAFSRAVRIPSRFDRDMIGDGGIEFLNSLPMKVGIAGADIASEVARTFEFGHRLQSGQRWSIDTSVFWTRYEKLRALRLDPSPSLVLTPIGPAFNMPLTETNDGSGRSYGGETWVTLQVRPGWRLIPSYTYLEENLTAGTPQELHDWLFASSSSRHQGLIRSQHDLSHRFQLDLMGRSRTRNVKFDLPGALFIDARLSWRPTHDSELSITGQNLGDRRVLETFSQSAFASIPTRRTFVAKWTYRF